MKRFEIIALLTLVALMAMGLGCSDDSKSNKDFKFTSAGDKLTSADDTNSRYYGADEALGDGDAAPMDDSEADGEVNAPTQGGDVSRDVVEADIFYPDGTTLYALNRYRGLFTVDVSNPNEINTLGNLRFRGMPQEMYKSDNTAYVLLHPEADSYASRRLSKLFAIDVSDPANPLPIAEFPLEGDIVDSRMVGNVIYVVTTRWAWYDYCGNQESGEKVVVTAINISDPSFMQVVDEEEFDGVGYAIYVNSNRDNYAIYLASTSYDDYDWDGSSTITYVDISDPEGEITKRGEMDAAGEVTNRFYMHEHNGIFSAVSHSWSQGAATIIETFDIQNPDNIVHLDAETIIDGEELKAVRYDGDRAYVVTFEITDPLFVVDLSNPSAINVTGELIIPDWSTHIEVRDNHILAVGTGWESRGTKVSLFSVADPTDPQELKTIEVAPEGGYAESEANWDFKAFKVYDDEGLILLPVRTFSYEIGNMADRLVLLDFDLDQNLSDGDSSTLVERGHVDCRGTVRRGLRIGEGIATLSDMQIQFVDHADRDNPTVTSSVLVANHVGKLHNCNGVLCEAGGEDFDGNLRIRTYNPEEDHLIPNFESDVLEAALNSYMYYSSSAALLTTGDTSYLVSQSYGEWDENGEWNDHRRMALHAFDTSGETPSYLGHSRIELPSDDVNNAETYAWGSGITTTTSGAMAYLGVSVTYDDEEDEEPAATAFLQFLNASDPGAVTMLSEQRFTGFTSLFKDYLDNYNYYGYGYDDIESPMPMDGDVAEPTATTRAQMYDDYYYANNNIGRPSLLVTRNNEIYIPHCEEAGYQNGDHDRPLLGCFAVVFDASDPASPREKARINVPGEIVGISQDGARIYARDRQWKSCPDSNQYYYEYSLEVLEVSGDQAQRIASFPLENRWESEDMCWVDEDVDDEDYSEGSVGNGTSVDVDEPPVAEADGDSASGGGEDESPDIDDGDGSALLARAKVIQDDQEFSTYQAAFIVQPDRVYVVEYQDVYGDGYSDIAVAVADGDSYNCDSEPEQDPEIEIDYSHRSVVKVVNPETGVIVETVTVEGASQVTEVEGGGVLIRKDIYGFYGGYMYGYGGYAFEPIRLIYVGPDGSTKEISRDLGYNVDYNYGNGAVRLGDTLHISAGWEGIFSVEL